MSTQIDGCQAVKAAREFSSYQDTVRMNQSRLDSLMGRVARIEEEQHRLDTAIAQRGDRIIMIQKRIEVPVVPPITDDNQAKKYLLDEILKDHK